MLADIFAADNSQFKRERFDQCVPARRKREGEIMNMKGAVMTLARWHAKKAIKRELYAKGIKLAHVEASRSPSQPIDAVGDHSCVGPVNVTRLAEALRRVVVRVTMMD